MDVYVGLKFIEFILDYVQALFEAYHAVHMLCQTVPGTGGLLCERSNAFVESEPKWTSLVPFWYALHPTPGCDTIA